MILQIVRLMTLKILMMVMTMTAMMMMTTTTMMMTVIFFGINIFGHSKSTAQDIWLL